MEQLRAWWRASAVRRFGQQLVDGLLDRCRAAGAVIRARVGPRVDTVLAAIDVAAVVYTARHVFARRHILAETRRHLLETLRGRPFPPGLDDYITDQALARHGHRLTVPQEGRRAPLPDQITYTADFSRPARWWIVGTNGTPPRESSRYERARSASLALQHAIHTARTTPTAMPDNAHPAGHDQTVSMPHTLDHPDGHTAAHAPHQAAPQGDPDDRTTDPATWLHTPENLARLAAFSHAADARRRAFTDPLRPEQPAAVASPAHQQQHQAGGTAQGNSPVSR